MPKEPLTKALDWPLKSKRSSLIEYVSLIREASDEKAITVPTSYVHSLLKSLDASESDLQALLDAAEITPDDFERSEFPAAKYGKLYQKVMWVMWDESYSMPDEKSGEAILLYVVSDTPELTEQDIRNFYREQLATYKVPRKVCFRDSLPKSNVGKVLRRELKQQLVVG